MTHKEKIEIIERRKAIQSATGVRLRQKYSNQGVCFQKRPSTGYT